jgi:hypothetical protein
LAVPGWSTARAGGAMIWRTSRGANRNRWGVCERALQPPCHGKASRGKPGPKPESENPTVRDCRGARGNVTSSLGRNARASALSRPGDRRPVASPRVSWMVERSLATAARQATHRVRRPEPHSTPADGKLPLGRSAHPRRVAEAGHRRLRTDGLAVSARPNAGSVANVADIPEEPRRRPLVPRRGGVLGTTRRCR